ncbi:MAG: SHOCT domain-containing protein [Flavobacteriaceae bacterium]
MELKFTIKTEAASGIKGFMEIYDTGIKYSRKVLWSKEETFVELNNVASLEIDDLKALTVDRTKSGKNYQLNTVDLNEAQKAVKIFSELSTNANKVNVNNNIADELLKLNDLKDKGILTQREFDEQKKKLLS